MSTRTPESRGGRQETEPRISWTRESIKEALELAKKALGPWVHEGVEAKEGVTRGRWVRWSLAGKDVVRMWREGLSDKTVEDQGFDAKSKLHWLAVVEGGGITQSLEIYGDAESPAKAMREVNEFLSKKGFLFVDD